MPETGTFAPDWVSPPGDTVGHILIEQNLTRQVFAQRMGWTLDKVEDLLNGRAEVTAKTAKQLAEVLGASEAFWMNRESQYRRDVARLRKAAKPEQHTEWLNELPVSDMAQRGWVALGHKPDDNVFSCLRFFGVPTVEAWRAHYGDVLQTVAFRTSASFESEAGATAAWLRQGELQAASIDSAAWNPTDFRAELIQIRALTREKDPHIFIPALQKVCASCGVAVVILRAPAKCRASGATRFVSPTRPMLLLSFRYLSDDHFWFSFFHEAGHLLLHGDRALILEIDDANKTKEEVEANLFAERLLIPDEFRHEFIGLGCNGREVMRFARKIGISPGIVVGQLQHSGRLTQRQLNNLKTRFAWSES